MKTKKLVIIKQEEGHSYVGHTGRPGLSSHRRLSTAIVLENGIPLPGPANAPHQEIREIGRGRYSFWYSNVYFSTSDNSNPLSNGREYAIQFLPNSISILSSIQSAFWLFFYFVSYQYVLLLCKKREKR